MSDSDESDDELTEFSAQGCDPRLKYILSAVGSGSVEERQILEISDSLNTYELVWIVKDKSPSETLQKLLENTGFFNGGVKVPEALEIVERCNGLQSIEQKMYEYTVWLKQSDFSRFFHSLGMRCEAVLYAVQFARKGIILLAKSISHSSDDAPYQLSNLPLEYPLHLNENLILEATTMANLFAESIGNKCNGKSNAWDLKSKAVKDLEMFFRTKLAVESTSFLFFDRENETLTDSRIWWKKSDAANFETLPWNYLLQGFGDGGGYRKYLGVIPKKDHQQFSRLLKTLVSKGLY